jgi:UPF0716 protein FxsA
MRILFLCFIVMPIMELVVLIEVGSVIGVLNTILAVLLTAVIGASLLRHQGLKTLFNANQKMREGQMPVSEMGEGLMLAVAGALLLTPGFVTDIVGFLLLTPGIRQLMLKSVTARLVKGVGSQSASFQYHYTEVRKASKGEDGDIIEGEYIRGEEIEAPKDRDK